MADTEFEEFRTYFEKLPQYIKAPPQCYSLVPNIDLLDDDSPTSSCQTTEVGLNAKITEGELSEDPQYSLNGRDLSVSQEPFAGDLQIVYTEQESPIVKRKRRKLPEIPKQSQKQWNERREVSLAEELKLSEPRLWGKLDSEIVPETDTFIPTSYQSGGSRPIFVLKFNDSNGKGSEDSNISSPDSEKYASLDSGHSTIHSDDGSIKPYSPQVTSINETLSPVSPTLSSSLQFSQLELEVLDATHRGLHKFVPRHHDELEIEIGDPIYVQKEADDLWCEGVNLRTGIQGIFPSAYVVDVEYNDFDPTTNKVKKERYLSNYIGSIETLYHKGNEVLCQAVKKITGQENYVLSHTRPCVLEISDQGIRMLDKGKHSVNQAPCHDYFYALKNISFCGFHPSDHRYFGFVTKHPTLNRFACHVFISDDTTRPVAEAVGRAFQRFYQKFLETAYPIEDIYIE